MPTRRACDASQRTTWDGCAYFHAHLSLCDARRGHILRRVRCHVDQVKDHNEAKDLSWATPKKQQGNQRDRRGSKIVPEVANLEGEVWEPLEDSEDEDEDGTGTE